ncbi:hypothetical protein DFAR_2520002 [Desulfarculales bacterium]
MTTLARPSLDDNEKALLLSIRQALCTPEALSDADIMDALWIDAGMKGMLSLFNALVKPQKEGKRGLSGPLSLSGARGQTPFFCLRE